MAGNIRYALPNRLIARMDRMFDDVGINVSEQVRHALVAWLDANEARNERAPAALDGKEGNMRAKYLDGG